MNRLDLFPSEEVIQQYRAVYSGSRAEDVLVQTLADFGLFEPLDNQEDIILHNQGIRFLRILGGGEIQRESIREFVKRLMKQPLKDR